MLLFAIGHNCPDVIENRKKIDITSFIPCLDTDNNPGVMCGADCRLSHLWCNGDFVASCDTGSGLVNTTDPVLCSNPLVWRNVSCSQYGVRCTGQNMQCVYPRYTRDKGNGTTIEEDPEVVEALFKFNQCSDKSDRVFQVGEPCPDTPDNICWESCDTPRPNCTACSNTTYFRCTESDQCVHPDLRCDGHPQCPGGEDEDLETCRFNYIKMGMIHPYATSRCRSPLYDNLEIYSIPCDGVTECSDGSDEDESFCNLLKVVNCCS